MTDSELLKSAAKAARIEWADGHESTGLRNANGTFWNPLTDSGQALELAVKLAIDFKVRNEATWWDRQESEGVVYWCHERHNGDPYAATRRAITRAAAELGKNL